MKISIMQPYFLPYIGYWQLIYNADIFVVYDTIEYTKKGWINRNRYCNGEYFTIPLKKDSDFLNVCDRYILFGENEKQKLLRKIKHFYNNERMFKEVFPIIDEIFSCKHKNLFDFVYNSIGIVSTYLGIKTKIIVSSEVETHPMLKNKDRVKFLCKDLCMCNCVYVNPIGGTGLYNYNDFRKDGIDLRFLKTNVTETLSIIDLMFRYEKPELKEMLGNYEEMADGSWAI